MRIQQLVGVVRRVRKIEGEKRGEMCLWKLSPGDRRVRIPRFRAHVFPVFRAVKGRELKEMDRYCVLDSRTIIDKSSAMEKLRDRRETGLYCIFKKIHTCGLFARFN